MRRLDRAIGLAQLPLLGRAPVQPGYEMSAANSFEVKLAAPLDVPASAELFSRWGDDLLDRWDGVSLLRTMPSGNTTIAYASEAIGTVQAPTLRVTVTNPAHRPIVEDAVRASFVVAPPEFAELVVADPVIARLDNCFKGLRTVLQFDLFAALVRCISAQQVNLRWSVVTRRRLVERFGDRHTVNGCTVYSLSAQRLAAATAAEIRALQFTNRTAQYIIGIAQAIAAQRLTLSDLAGLSNAEVISRLSALRGIGAWTAEWILARTLGRPCVVAGDLGVRKAVGLAYLNAALPCEREVRAAAAHWGLSANVAQTLLLHGLAKNMLNAPPT